jgi:uncharacterized protein YigA (DUF484 family)
VEHFFYSSSFKPNKFFLISFDKLFQYSFLSIRRTVLHVVLKTIGNSFNFVVGFLNIASRLVVRKRDPMKVRHSAILDLSANARSKKEVILFSSVVFLLVVIFKSQMTIV